MRVRVHAAGQDVLTGGIDHARAWGREVTSDLDDPLALDTEVGQIRIRGGDQRAVLDDQVHAYSVDVQGSVWQAIRWTAPMVRPAWRLPGAQARRRATIRSHGGSVDVT